jgi:hypothetical protein
LVGICSRLCMLRQWTACLLSATDLDGEDRIWIWHQVSIQDTILYTGHIHFWSLGIKGLYQVRSSLDNKKAFLYFYTVFENPVLAIEIVSWKTWDWALQLENVCFSKLRAWIVYATVDICHIVCVAWVLSRQCLEITWKIKREIEFEVHLFILSLLTRAIDVTFHRFRLV